MEKLNWVSVPYNGLETNLEVTRCGKVRRVEKDWYGKGSGAYQIKYGEINFTKLKPHKDGYKTTNANVKDSKQKTVQVHQLVAAAFLGYKFNRFKLVVDHKDSNPLNNNLSNLRVISHRINISKEKSIKSGLPVGVSYRKSSKKYRSQIRINGKQIYLGSFDTPEEASNAYQNKLNQINLKKIENNFVIKK